MSSHRPMFLVVLALVAAACTSGSGVEEPIPTSTTVDDGFPVVIDAGNGSVTIEARPDRIVSISPTSTEVLFAIGAGDQVVAVDSLSNYPANAPVTDLSSWTPSVEAIAEFEPDLVFLSFDPGDVIAGLEALGIPVILHGTAFSLDDAYAQWEQTGAATGHLGDAVRIVATTQNRMAAAAESVVEVTEGVTYYYELEDTFFTTTSGSFIGGVLALTGLTNVADQAPDPDGFGYPQLSQEFIVESDPTLILLADTICCGVSAETISERPGWGTITAVRNGGIVELDDDIASRWSPRVAELLDAVVETILAMVSANA